MDFNLGLPLEGVKHDKEMGAKGAIVEEELRRKSLLYCSYLKR
jgi:hypothetical protein